MLKLPTGALGVSGVLTQHVVLQPQLSQHQEPLLDHVSVAAQRRGLQGSAPQ